MKSMQNNQKIMDSFQQMAAFVNMNNPDFEFWFEFASTYSYLSVCRIEELAKENGIDIKWKPFLLGPTFISFCMAYSNYLQQSFGVYLKY